MHKNNIGNARAGPKQLFCGAKIYKKNYFITPPTPTPIEKLVILVSKTSLIACPKFCISDSSKNYSNNNIPVNVKKILTFAIS
jgi:hypothetical protein